MTDAAARADELPAAAAAAELSRRRAHDHLASWLATTDHKRIAILYALTITFFFFLGGAAISLVRLELFTPTGRLLSRPTPTTGSSRSTAS